MDSFELNKIAGAVLFALLILFGTRTIADIIFAVHKPEKPGWEVAIPESIQGPATGQGQQQEQPIAALLAKASVEKGEAVHKKCTSCHSFEAGGPNKIGPNLHGVVGNQVASHEGFAYSDALKAKGGTWGYEELNEFLKNPKAAVPGTKMAFAGVKDDGQRADLIMYLRSLDDNPPPLPEAPAGEQPAAGAQPPAGRQAPAGQQGGAQGPAAQQGGQQQPSQQKPAPTEDQKPATPEATTPAQPQTVPSDKAVPDDRQTPPVVPQQPGEQPQGGAQQGQQPSGAPAQNQ